MPFDPIAAREAERLGIKVIIVGKDINNLRRLLENKKFRGTFIR